VTKTSHLGIFSCTDQMQKRRCWIIVPYKTVL